MFRERDDLARLLIALVSLCALLTIGCAARKDMTKAPLTDLDLQYRLAADQVLRYELKSSFVQTIELRAKAMEITASDNREFTVKSKSGGEVNLNLLLTIEAIDISIATPEGEIVPDVSQVIGESFEMTVSPLGEELEILGADVIQYDMGAQGKQSIESQFSAFFPDLPGRPVGVKDTWTTESTIMEETANGDVEITIESDNTLVGFETIRGLECAKIIAPFTGTLKGKGEEQGAELVTDAKLKGTSTWYFAYKEGIYVKESSAGTAEGTVTVMGPEKMKLPLKRDFEIEVSLLK